VALDGLRGVAALMVLFHHTLLTLPDFANYEWQVPGATAHGVIEWLLLRTPLRLLWAGQERALLFFVLSGFVLGLPWLEGRAAPYGRFLLGRFCRIYPPYLLAMIAAAAGSMLLGGIKLPHATVYFNQLGWSFTPSWPTVPSILAVLNNPTSRYMNEAVWTLVWEVRVALIFPLIILPIARWRNTGIVLVLVALVLLRHVSARVLGVSWLAQTLSFPQNTFYYAQYFVLGAAVAANRGVIASWFAVRSKMFGPVCLALGCLICWLPWPMQHDHIVGIGAAVILASIVGGGYVGSWLAKPSLIWLGKQSYSLYLIHLPLIMVVVIAFGGKVPVLACIAILPAAIVLAEVFHQWVETPSVALTQRLTGYSKRGGSRGRPSPRTSTDTTTITPPLSPINLPTAGLGAGMAREQP
jgi:peptidoglycan/LPS O-acetylase OafA/YrhL